MNSKHVYASHSTSVQVKVSTFLVYNKFTFVYNMEKVLVFSNF